jgi:hypothetical protein
MKRLVGTLILWGYVLVAVVACQTDARQQLMATSGGQVELRSIQTRAFDTTDRVKTLTTVIATLQDLEFLIDRADASLGVVTATKTKGLAQLRMSVTIHPRGSDQTLVRASGQFKLESVDDPEFYQQFFAALGRSMFLTAHDVAAPAGVSVAPSEAHGEGPISASATSSHSSFYTTTVPAKTATSPNPPPFDGVWLLEIGLANGGGDKDRIRAVVTNGRFSTQFTTSGWRGRLGGEINEFGILSAKGTVNRNNIWYSKGALAFEARFDGGGFRKVVDSKARVSESFEISMTSRSP